jgi:hypothetical protein
VVVGLEYINCLSAENFIVLLEIETVPLPVALTVVVIGYELVFV